VTPFLQFRIWLRRASAGQKAVTGLGAALVVSLLVWTAIPSGTATPGRAGSASPLASPAPGQPGASTSTTTAPGLSGAGSTGPPAGAASQVAGGAPSGTQSPAATTAPGTPTAGLSAPTACPSRGTLRIGVVVPEAAGGSLNPVIGAPPGSQEEADYAAVFDDVNRAGGVDCYNLVGDFAISDLANPSSARSSCLQMIQDKVFAVLGGFEPLFSDDCILQAHIPTFDQLPIPEGVARQYFPYYFSTLPTWQRLYKNFVYAMNQLGYFSPARHFAKFGIFYEDCTPEILQALLSDLASVGVSGSKVDTFDLGCSDLASPSAIEQAVLKFKTDGVTAATISDDYADGQNITNTANSQGWKPMWLLPDYGEVAVQNSANAHPNGVEFDGALAVTADQTGAIAAQLPETPGTQRCDKIMVDHHLPTVYQSADQFAGSTCSLVWMLVAALQHSTINQTGIVAGLQAAKTVELSFPNGPDDFSAPGTTTAGEFWRIDTYHATCQCWETVNPTWNPSF
jgi:hypothetical protein